MYEKVNPSHPDKVADRIAGALVDLAYAKVDNPKIAVEVLIGHGVCHIIAETSVVLNKNEVKAIVKRIAGNIKLDLKQVPQDDNLACNQQDKIRCGDNGIFKGVPVTVEQKTLSGIARNIYKTYGFDGKYIFDMKKNKLIICQSNAKYEDLKAIYKFAAINPLGYWTGGTDVDSGATNRKLGSDMADSVTGGGLCLSRDTEYLGEDLKWHLISEYKGGKIAQWNNGKLEFIEPIKYIHNEKDKFIHIYNCSKLDMKLTPFHQVLIKTSKNNLIKKDAQEIALKLERQIGNCGSILHSFKYEPNILSKYKNEYDVRLQIAFCADGTLLPNGKGRIRVKRQYKKDRLRSLFYLANIEYKETQDNEYSIFWYTPTIYNKYLYDCLVNEDYKIIYDEIYKWDGNEKHKLFRTTIKEDADFIQLVIASLGKVATINCDDRQGLSKGKYVCLSNCYSVHELKSNETQLRKTKNTPINVEFLENAEPSYCFEVPSHNLVVRYNNKIFITGNCGKDLSKADVSVNIYAFLKAQETGQIVELCCAIGDDTVDGKPYEEIVEIAREYIKNVGGFEKFAEWGLLR